MDNGPAVGVLPASAAGNLARGKLDFADRTLLEFDWQNLTAIVRKQGKDELELVQSGINWEITKPTKQKADRETAERLAGLYGRLRATRVAALEPALDLEDLHLVPGEVTRKDGEQLAERRHPVMDAKHLVPSRPLLAEGGFDQELHRGGHRDVGALARRGARPGARFR